MRNAPPRGEGHETRVLSTHAGASTDTRPSFLALFKRPEAEFLPGRSRRFRRLGKMDGIALVENVHHTGLLSARDHRRLLLPLTRIRSGCRDQISRACDFGVVAADPALIHHDRIFAGKGDPRAFGASLSFAVSKAYKSQNDRSSEVGVESALEKCAASIRR